MNACPRFVKQIRPMECSRRVDKEMIIFFLVDEYGGQSDAEKLVVVIVFEERRIGWYRSIGGRR